VATVLDHEGFDPNVDSATLETAMRGPGTDEDAIIEVLAHRTVAQRLKIADVYRELFEKVILPKYVFNFISIIKC